MSMSVRIKYLDKSGKVKTLDQLFPHGKNDSLVIIDSLEYETHEGHSFTTQVTDDTMSDTDTLTVAFKTCLRESQTHMWVGFTTLVGGYCQLLEGPTWTTNTGTLIPIINRERSQSHVISILGEDKTTTPAFSATNNLLANVTDLAGGTALWTRYAWGERGQIEGGSYRAENQFVLKSGTTYAAKFTAVGSSNKAQLYLNWIER